MTLHQYAIKIGAKFIYASSGATYGLGEIGFDDIRGLPSASSQEGWQVDPEPEENLRHDELEAAIDWLFAIYDNSNIPEIALLFFAGHGLRQVKGRLTQGFLATSRANPSPAGTSELTLDERCGF